MAFLKFANANLIKPDIHRSAWDNIRTASVGKQQFLSRSASSIPLGEYSPGSYMLSHCTIVASVDTEVGPGIVGSSASGGPNRKYADYYVTPETAKYINSNQDCWERKLLLSAAPSFVGGENYVEHVQIPELSKGKIIDMAARDIGDSIYIDILVATNRKHADLVKSILSHKLSTLSMGCSIKFSICTRCGNVAVDPTELCAHIRYEKGNTFIDDNGVSRKTAELCGHIDNEPGSVEFIEASWVETPAFPGAVVRNILTPEVEEAYKKAHAEKLQVAFSGPARIADSNLRAKAAGFGFEQQQQEPSDPQPKKDPLDSAVDDLSDFIKNKALRSLKKQMTPETSVPNDLDENQNTTILKEASSKGPAYTAVLSMFKTAASAEQLLAGLTLFKLGGWPSVVASKKYSGRQLLAMSRVLDLLESKPDFAGVSKVYGTVLNVGGLAKYENERAYLRACESSYGRALTASEKNLLLEKGKIFSATV